MSYTIKAINSTREWESKHGPMMSYRLDLTGPDGRLEGGVELAQKKATPAPQVGQTLEGTIDTSGQYGPKFKKAQPQGGGRPGAPRARDPQERNSIERQVAYKGAVEIVVAQIENLDSDSTKNLLTDFFNHSLMLLQGPATELADPEAIVKKVFPGSTSLAGDARKNGTAVSPAQATLDEMKRMFQEWRAVDPAADEVWANKLTSFGLTSASEASDPQMEDLIDFLKGRVPA